MAIRTPPIFPFNRYITYNYARHYDYKVLVSRMDSGAEQRRPKDEDEDGEPNRSWDLKFSPLDGFDLAIEYLKFWRQQRGPCHPFFFYDKKENRFFLARFSERMMSDEEAPVHLFETGVKIVQCYDALP